MMQRELSLCDRINNAISWYNLHWVGIQEAAPISHDGVTYPEAYFQGLERFIKDWHQNALHPNLANAYILKPLQRIKAALTLRSQEPQVPHFAITLHRPWAYATLKLGKHIENRSWPCPLPVGTWIAIHASKQWDAEGEAWIERMGLGLVGEPENHPEMVILGLAQFTGNVHESESPWFFGPVGWQWGNTLLLPKPIPCRGRQKLWNLSSEIMGKIREQL